MSPSADEVTVAALIVPGKHGLELEIGEEARTELVRSIRLFRKHGAVTVRVREGREPKSLKQLKYLHGKVFRDMAEYTGNDIYIVKWEMKKKFLTRQREVVDLETGEVMMREYVPSLADLNSDEMNTFIDECRLFAAEWMHLEIEPPDPAWREKKKAVASGQEAQI